MKWRFLDTGIMDGALNMAVDEAILMAQAEERVPPTLRFYRWNPPCFSLGYFQSAAKEIELDQLSERGVHLVRRLTGGRAILHHEEVTYSIILPEESGLLPSGVIESYSVLSQGILNALQQLGLTAQLVKSKPQKGFSAACFDTPSWYELQIEGKKVAGSAQTRRDKVLLQHGSLPLSTDTDLLFGLLKFSSQEQRERMKRRFEKKATSINDELETKVEYDEVKTALFKGWKQTLQLEGEWEELTSWEKNRALELKEKKYSSPQWNKRR